MIPLERIVVFTRRSTEVSVYGITRVRSPSLLSNPRECAEDTNDDQHVRQDTCHDHGVMVVLGMDEDVDDLEEEPAGRPDSWSVTACHRSRREDVRRAGKSASRMDTAKMLQDRRRRPTHPQRCPLRTLQVSDLPQSLLRTGTALGLTPRNP